MSPTSYRTAPPRVIGRTWNPELGTERLERLSTRPRTYQCNTWMSRGKGRARNCSAFLIGWTDVFDDEQLLAGLHQPELAAGDLFDRIGIFTQPAGLFAEL